MSWIQALCETYDQYFSGTPLSDPHPLVPVGFIEKQLDICIYLLPDGTFHSASVLEERDKHPVPTNSEAEGRTGSVPVPYPICDELRYVAGDLSAYTQTNFSRYFQAYFENLENWCQTPDTPPELLALKAYLEKKRVIADLINSKLLYLDENGHLLNKWPDRKTKPLFFNLGKPAEKCIVDFAVLRENAFIHLRQLESIQKCWLRFLLSRKPEKQLCYSSGQLETAVYNHAKIEGNAKLISAKDGPRDFQYKGRFESMEQAYSVSYTASAKAHNTLRWLRSRQGFTRFGATFIAWSTMCRPIIAPQDAADEGWGTEDEDEEKNLPQTEQAYARKISAAMAGFRETPEYQKGSKIVMLGMEAATTGRMSINYYQELDGSDYLNRLNLWYTHCYWRLMRKRGQDKRPFEYIATPTLQELGEAVFGTRNMAMALEDKKVEKPITKQIKNFNMEILSCIANGQPIPQSFARAAFRRACRPESFTNQNGKWQREEWLKCLAVACAMGKSANKKEEYQVSLDRNEKDPSYLYGRLMAVADCAEIKAMENTDAQHRQTNAIRYFSAMQQRPAATWAVVESRLQPYLAKLKEPPYDEKYFRALLDEIQDKADPKAMYEAQSLSFRFLEAYHCQRYEILKKNFNKER